MFLTQHEQERLLIHVAADVAAPAPGARAAAQLPRGGRDHHRVPARGRARRAHRGRADGGRPARAHPRRRDGRRAGDAGRGAGRGHLPGRHQARHRARADPVTVDPGRDPRRRRRRSRSTRAGRCIDADRRSTPATGRSRSARTTTSPRPTRRCEFDRAAAWGHRLAVPAGTVGAVRARASPARSTWSRSAGAGSCPACAARRRAAGPSTGDTVSSIDRRRYAALYGPTAGDRIRLADTDLLIEVERGPLRRRRRGGLRRRQGDPRVDGPVPGHPRRGHAGHGHHRRGRARPLGRRQGRRRHPRRPDRRRSARPATPTRWTASTPTW